MCIRDSCFCDETCDHSAETGTDCYLKGYADESESSGSCYDLSSFTLECDIGHAECAAKGAYFYWFSPGYISGSSGCCHCDASCDHDLETPQVMTPIPGYNCDASIAGDCDSIDLEVVGCSVVYYGADGTQGSGGGHGAEYSYGAWQTLAGYQTATDICLLYTSPSPRDATLSRMPSSA